MPRVSDLDALAASTRGKVEIESLEEGRDGEIIDRLVKAAVLTVFRERCRTEDLRDVVDAFDDGRGRPRRRRRAGRRLRRSRRRRSPALRSPVNELTGGDERPAAVASAVEFVLEGLHLSKRLNKDAVGARATYRSRG